MTKFIDLDIKINSEVIKIHDYIELKDDDVIIFYDTSVPSDRKELFEHFEKYPHDVISGREPVQELTYADDMVVTIYYHKGDPDYYMIHVMDNLMGYSFSYFIFKENNTDKGEEG